jgi:hypothetical protein
VALGYAGLRTWLKAKAPQVAIDASPVKVEGDPERVRAEIAELLREAARETMAKMPPVGVLLALLLAPSLAFADCPPMALHPEDLQPHRFAPYLVAGLWSGAFITARCWRVVRAAVDRVALRHKNPPWSSAGPWALALLVMLPAAGCGATTKQIAATATIATVQTIDEGLAQFAAWATNEEDAIAEAAVRSCAGKATRAEYNACTSAIVTPRRAPIDKAKAAIRLYRAALAGGERLAQGDLAITAQSVVEALAAVGIRVVAGGAP